MPNNFLLLVIAGSYEVLIHLKVAIFGKSYKILFSEVRFSHQLPSSLFGSNCCYWVQSWLITYLSVPLGESPMKMSFWEPVLSKMSKKLTNLNKEFLSKRRRLTLIYVVLNAMPLQFMSIFRVPGGYSEDYGDCYQGFSTE